MTLENLYQEEPKPLDENDPEVLEDLFESLHFSGVRVTEVHDAKLQEGYQNWLATKQEECE